MLKPCIHKHATQTTVQASGYWGCGYWGSGETATHRKRVDVIVASRRTVSPIRAKGCNHHGHFRGLTVSQYCERIPISARCQLNVSALSYVHKLSTLPDPSIKFLVQKLLTAHNRLHSAPDVWLPITCSVFHRLALAENLTNFSAF